MTCHFQPVTTRARSAESRDVTSTAAAPRHMHSDLDDDDDLATTTQIFVGKLRASARRFASAAGAHAIDLPADTPSVTGRDGPVI